MNQKREKRLQGRIRIVACKKEEKIQSFQALGRIQRLVALLTLAADLVTENAMDDISVLPHLWSYDVL